MKVIAVGNMKGGVGKTTVAVQLACELSQRNHRVLLIDLDEQGTATEWCKHGKLPMQSSAVQIETVQQARDFIQTIPTYSADIAVLDLPPHTRESTEAALWVSDVFAVPVTPSGADFVSTRKALSICRSVREHRNGYPKTILIPSKVDKRTSFGKEIQEALQGFGEPVSPAVHQRSIHVECFGLGEWIGSIAKTSEAYQDIHNMADAVLELIEW